MRWVFALGRLLAVAGGSFVSASIASTDAEANEVPPDGGHEILMFLNGFTISCWAYWRVVVIFVASGREFSRPFTKLRVFVEHDHQARGDRQRSRRNRGCKSGSRGHPGAGPRGRDD